jgi:hypothetical protein
MSWRDERYCDRQRLIVCPGGHGETFDADRCAALLEESGLYSFGDHVSDPLAIIKRYLHFAGHKDVCARNTHTMRCPTHCKEMKDG